MRDLGQYYTHDLVIKFMIDLCKPNLNEVIIDPTAGTGGFLTMTIKYLEANFDNIDWDEQKNIYMVLILIKIIVI